MSDKLKETIQETHAIVLFKSGELVRDCSFYLKYNLECELLDLQQVTACGQLVLMLVCNRHVESEEMSVVHKTNIKLQRQFGVVNPHLTLFLVKDFAMTDMLNSVVSV